MIITPIAVIIVIIPRIAVIIMPIVVIIAIIPGIAQHLRDLL